MRRALGWVLLALALGFIGGAVYMFAVVNPTSTGDMDRFSGSVWLLSYVGFPIVGAILVSRFPRDPMGWILCGIGVSIGGSSFAGDYAQYAIVVRQGELPAGTLASWLTSWFHLIGVGCVILLMIVFPRGRSRNAFWRRAALVVVAVSAALTLMYAFRAGPLDNVRQIRNPLGVDAIAPVVNVLIPIGANVLTFIFLAAIVDKFVMFRRAKEQERQQLKWFALAAVAFPILFALSIAVETVVGRSASGFDPVVLAFFVAFNGLAVAIGIAAFKYRLYDIDVFINKTLVYGGLSAGLAVAYVGVIALLQAVLPTEGNDLAVAASTLAAAALFAPLRRRIQAFVDQRFYRRRYDAAHTIEQFSARLRDEVDLEELRSDLLGVVSTTMQPAHASLWLRTGAGA